MTTENTVGQETPQTPTETIETVKAELARVTKELESKDKGLRTAHQTLTEKDRKLKEVSDLHTRLDSLEETLNLYTAVLAEQRQTSPDELADTVSTRKPDLMKVIESEKAKIADRRKRAEAESQAQANRDAIQAKVDSYKERVEKLGLDPKSKSYRKLKDFVTAGLFDAADAELEDLEGDKTKVSKKEDESLEQMAERRAQEILREKGLLKTETGVPAGSGKTFTREQISKMSPSEYEKNRQEIWDAMSGGRIK